jgi:hypothetical protein
MRAVVQHLLHEVAASDSTANLYFYVGRAEQCLNLRGVAASAGDRIEIDDMEISKTVLSPRGRYSHRIRNPDYFLVIGAAGKLNTGTAAQIERGNCDHRARRLIEAWIMTAEGAALIACWRACE